MFKLGQEKKHCIASLQSAKPWKLLGLGLEEDCCDSEAKHLSHIEPVFCSISGLRTACILKSYNHRHAYPPASSTVPTPSPVHSESKC